MSAAKAEERGDRENSILSLKVISEIWEPQRLIDLGWSAEAAAFLLGRQDQPEMKKLLSRIFGVRFRTRSKAKPKQSIPGSLRKAVFERDAYRCKNCGDWHNLSVDHIFPESKGGTLDLSNLQTLCITCNRKKGARS